MMPDSSRLFPYQLCLAIYICLFPIVLSFATFGHSGEYNMRVPTQLWMSFLTPVFMVLMYRLFTFDLVVFAMTAVAIASSVTNALGIYDLLLVQEKTGYSTGFHLFAVTCIFVNLGLSVLMSIPFIHTCKNIFIDEPPDDDLKQIPPSDDPLGLRNRK